MFGFERGSFLYVVTGPMGAGKTSWLVEEASKIQSYSRYECQAFKPSLDDRYSDSDLASRTGKRLKSTIIDPNKPFQMLDNLENRVDVIVIDEAHFFEDSLVYAVDVLLRNDKKVLVSGLDLDFRGEYFPVMGKLLAMADDVKKMTSFCEYRNELGERCGAIARNTQRLYMDGSPVPYDDPLILVGDETGKKNERIYQARCRKHHIVPGKPEFVKSKDL